MPVTWVSLYGPMPRTSDDRDRSLFEANRAALRDLPPSAKLVAKTLDRTSGLSQGQIAEETLLPDRTVRYGLNRLEEADVVTTSRDLSDARRQLYTLQPPE